MSNSSSSGSSGLDIMAILGIVFIVLKLCGVITWSWWWVLAPFWIGFALAFVFVVLFVIIYGFSAVRHNGKNK